MKKKLIWAAVAAIGLSLAGYFGFQYFSEHYVLLDENDIFQMQMSVEQLMQRAYQMGAMQACT